jgi:hypothetical protein
MKPGTLTTGRVLLSLLIIIVTVGLVSWDHKQTPGRYQQAANDTTPKKIQEKKITDLDDALDELNNGEWKQDMEKAMKEMKEAWKNIDGDKIRMDIEKAMKDVDFNKIKEQINSAMKEVDFSKLQAELKESIAKIDLDKIKTELDKVKDVDMKDLEVQMDKVKEEMKNLKPKLEKEMEKAKGEIEKAKVEIEKAKVEIKEYKDFVDDLEKDGLIKKDHYELKHSDGVLLINGQAASQQTYTKYRNFLYKHKKFSIQKNNDHFNIDMD